MTSQTAGIFSLSDGSPAAISLIRELRELLSATTVNYEGDLVPAIDAETRGNVERILNHTLGRLDPS